MNTKKTFKISAIALGTVVAITVIFIAVYLLLIAPSFVGKTGPDGAMLKQYIEPAELKKLTENPDESIWIIDVRPESAYRDGHIPTAQSFPSTTIMARLNELPRDKYLIIYCETGGRVQIVTKRLAKAGYTRYMNWGANYRWKYDRATGDN